jgi:hypothetical protein
VRLLGDGALDAGQYHALAGRRPRSYIHTPAARTIARRSLSRPADRAAPCGDGLARRPRSMRGVRGGPSFPADAFDGRGTSFTPRWLGVADDGAGRQAEAAAPRPPCRRLIRAFHSLVCGGAARRLCSSGGARVRAARAHAPARLRNFGGG